MNKIIFGQKLGFDTYETKGQVSIELAVAIIVAFIFLLATIQIFIWLNSMMTNRQRYYQDSRTQAGDFDSPGTFSYTPPTLNIFQGAQ